VQHLTQQYQEDIYAVVLTETLSATVHSIHLNMLTVPSNCQLVLTANQPGPWVYLHRQLVMTPCES